ncbi:hypothetical protein [Lactobacillus delbrueckii]|uniref:hypothetical protein n=1 Tax=Lactobacillus delbrueckii TaxID=1584 RepID=UPI003A88C3E7
MNKKNNLAILAPEAVYPANTGGRIVVFNKIKYLLKSGYNVTLFCIVDSDEEAKVQDVAMAKLGVKSYSYNRNTFKKRNLINTLKYPYAVASRDNKKLKQDLRALVEQDCLDVIDIEFPQMAVNILDIDIIREKKINIILNQHNIEYRAMRSISKALHNPVKHTIFQFEASRLKKFEEKIYNSGLVNGYTFVSMEDLRRTPAN